MYVYLSCRYLILCDVHLILNEVIASTHSEINYFWAKSRTTVYTTFVQIHSMAVELGNTNKFTFFRKGGISRVTAYREKMSEEAEAKATNAPSSYLKEVDTDIIIFSIAAMGTCMGLRCKIPQSSRR